MATVLNYETSGACAGRKMRVAPGAYFGVAGPVFSVTKGLFIVTGCGLVPESAPNGELSRAFAAS